MSVNPALSLVDIGIVVSTPQQCLRSHEFCSRLAYLCFDLERLTELAMGANPFTCSKIVAQYMQRGLIKENPFKAVDDFCVGTLMKQCIEECKRVNTEMKFGAYCGSNYVCSRSLYYLHGMRVDFISCDPFKVPIARLVLAQAQIDEFAPEKTYELDPDSLRKDSSDTRADEVLDDWTVFF
jgi:pyruvate,orthophosphate dikinase